MNNQIELKGFKGLGCYQAYLSAIYFLPITPAYSKQNMGNSEVLQDFKKSDENRKKEILTQLFGVHHFSERDAAALIGVHKDGNGVPYSSFNIDNLPIKKVMELIIDSMLHCANASDDLFF